MASLLAKFRIEYESLTMINDIMEAPQASTREFFDDLLKGFRENTCKEEGNLKKKSLSFWLIILITLILYSV